MLPGRSSVICDRVRLNALWCFCVAACELYVVDVLVDRRLSDDGIRVGLAWLSAELSTIIIKSQ